MTAPLHHKMTREAALAEARRRWRRAHGNWKEYAQSFAVLPKAERFTVGRWREYGHYTWRGVRYQHETDIIGRGASWEAAFADATARARAAGG